MGSNAVYCPACGGVVRGRHYSESLVTDKDEEEIRCRRCHAKLVVMKHVTVDYDVRLAEKEVDRG